MTATHDAASMIAGLQKFGSAFRSFALKGNVIDLALAVIIGGAFNQIVQSLVNDVLMPPFGFLLGRMDFQNLVIRLNGTEIRYGRFLNTVVSFLIVTLVLFFIIRALNRFRRKQEETTKACPFCYSIISLKATRCAQCTSDLK